MNHKRDTLDPTTGKLVIESKYITSINGEEE
jgi:hypothetical protein